MAETSESREVAAAVAKLDTVRFAAAGHVTEGPNTDTGILGALVELAKAEG